MFDCEFMKIASNELQLLQCKWALSGEMYRLSLPLSPRHAVLTVFLDDVSGCTQNSMLFENSDTEHPSVMKGWVDASSISDERLGGGLMLDVLSSTGEKSCCVEGLNQLDSCSSPSCCWKKINSDRV